MKRDMAKDESRALMVLQVALIIAASPVGIAFYLAAFLAHVALHWLRDGWEAIS